MRAADVKMSLQSRDFMFVNWRIRSRETLENVRQRFGETMAETNYIQKFQDSLAGLNQVNTAARDQRLSIEKELDTDPYFDHLYSEQAYDHLTFLELRRTNHLLMTLIQMLSNHHGGPEIDLSQVFPHKISNETVEPIAVEYEPAMKEMDPSIAERENTTPILEPESPELQSMSEAERGSARRGRPTGRR